MKDIYLDIDENSCKIISNLDDAKGTLVVPVVLESNEVNLEHQHKIIITQKQLIKNPNLLRSLADAITDSLTLFDAQNINCYLEDIKGVLKLNSTSYINIAEGHGDDCGLKAVQSIIDTPFFLQGSSSVLLLFRINPDYPIMAISDDIDILYEFLDDDADIIFSIAGDSTLPIDRVKVSMIFTG